MFTELQAFWPGQFYCSVEDELVSTQLWDPPTPLQHGEAWLIVAKKQTEGRGRGDRQWVSASGNLSATFLFRRPEPAPFPLSTLSLLSAAALFLAVKPWVSTKHRAELKWPNDLLVDGKKLSGLLVSAARDTVRIGVGVNVLEAPQNIPGAKRFPISLAACSEKTPPPFSEEVGVAFGRVLLPWLTSWWEGTEPPWRQVWQEAGPLGREVRLEDGRVGRAVSLGPSGELWVEAEGKRFACTSEELV